MIDKVAKAFGLALCILIFGSLAVLGVVGIWHIILDLI